MDLEQAYRILNFWINKYIGSYYSPPELDDIVDRGQIALYTDLQPRYATSQRIKDALAPFRTSWTFTPSDTISGYIPIPSNLNYLNLLDLYITYQLSDVTRYAPVQMVNEDERANRLNSQIDPVTATSPIGEVYAPGLMRIYPQSVGYDGTVTFLRRPVAPYFAYTIISERVIVYDEANSTQLEWRETEMDSLLIKALKSAGINLSDAEISQFAQINSQLNYEGINKL